MNEDPTMRSIDDKKVYEINRDQLPLHCPTSAMSLWNSHPRVFLPIEEGGRAACPYCGTVFTLKND